MGDATRDRLEGKVDEIKGRGKSAAGELTDNQQLRDEGHLDQAVGQVKQGVADAKDKVGGFVRRLTGDKDQESTQQQ